MLRGPVRRPLADEGADSFFGLRREHVGGHDFARVAVGSASGISSWRRMLPCRSSRCAQAWTRSGAQAPWSPSQRIRRHDAIERPNAHRSSAETISPVSSIFIACLRPTLARERDHRRRTEQAEFTPGVANRASVEATARSQLATSWHPAAVAMPCTSAITGLGCRTMVCMSREHCAKTFAKASRPASAPRPHAVISFRSCPAQKRRPLGCQDDCSQRVVLRSCVQFPLERLHQCFAQGISWPRPGSWPRRNTVPSRRTRRSGSGMAERSSGPSKEPGGKSHAAGVQIRARHGQLYGNLYRHRKSSVKIGGSG